MSQDAEFDRLSDLLENALSRKRKSMIGRPKTVHDEWYMGWRQGVVEKQIRALMESADEFLKLASMELDIDIVETAKEINKCQDISRCDLLFKSMMEQRLGGKYRDNPDLKHLEMYLESLLEYELGL